MSLIAAIVPEYLMILKWYFFDQKNVAAIIIDLTFRLSGYE
jgi:hypothetical protein